MALPGIANAQYIVAPNSQYKVPIGEVLKVKCNSGMTSLGNSRVVCGQHGQWIIPQIKCVLKKTRRNGCSRADLPSIRNAYFIPNLSQYQIGTLVNVNCQSNFTIVGNPVILCGSNGIWSQISHIYCFNPVAVKTINK